MNYFLLVSIVTNDGNRAGIMHETPRGLYEVYINAAGVESFMFNSRWVNGLPVDDIHVKDTAAIFKKFNEFRHDLQKYAITDCPDLWWELRSKIT